MGDDFTLAFVVAGATIEQGAASDRKHPRLIFGRIHVVQNIKGTLVRRPTTKELSTSWDFVRTRPHLAQKGFGERIDGEGDESGVEIQFLGHDVTIVTRVGVPGHEKPISKAVVAGEILQKVNLRSSYVGIEVRDGNDVTIRVVVGYRFPLGPRRSSKGW